MSGWGSYGGGYDDREDRPAKKKVDQWKALRSASPLASKFVDRLTALDVIIPSGDDVQMMKGQFVRLAEGHPLTLTSVICPDYGTGMNFDSRLTYNFNDLGDGVGLVAGRALDVHVSLLQFFGDEGVEAVSSELLMADQEVTPENCKRVGIDEVEFLARLRRSQEALKVKATEKGVSISAPLLVEPDQTSWSSAVESARTMIQQVPDAQVQGVRRVRSSFLQRWAGRRLETHEIDEMIRGQGAEYITVGKHLARTDRLILGLDAIAMAMFLRRGTKGVTPVVYFKRPDY